MDLGKTIKKIRKTKGLKQKDFARLCEITPSYLSQIENNLKEPNLSILKVLSDKLAIPLPILFFLALDDDDIVPEKKIAFKMINPAVKSMVNEFFIPVNID